MPSLDGQCIKTTRLRSEAVVVVAQSRRRTRSGYGLAGVVLASLGLAWVAVGITLGLAFF